MALYVCSGSWRDTQLTAQRLQVQWVAHRAKAPPPACPLVVSSAMSLHAAWRPVSGRACGTGQVW